MLHFLLVKVRSHTQVLTGIGEALLHRHLQSWVVCDTGTRVRLRGSGPL